MALVNAQLGSWRHWHTEDVPLRLGVSSCLLGNEVRFDGGHTRDRFLCETLGQWAMWVPVCPEVEIGMTIPRPSIRIVESDAGLRLVAPSTEEDFTKRMHTYATRRAKQLAEMDLDGYILQKNSPSCGMERISVYRDGKLSHRKGVGMFASVLMEALPQLPLEEDGRLHDNALRENFIERIFSRQRWKALVRGGMSRRRLVEFHTAHKLLLRTHSETHYSELGRIVANADKQPLAKLYDSYATQLHDCLRIPATRKRNANVLQHALGYFKEKLDPTEKREILASIDDYRGGLLPLVVPLALLRLQIRKFEDEYLSTQLYFDPHPKELMLRNHA